MILNEEKRPRPFARSAMIAICAAAALQWTPALADTAADSVNADNSLDEVIVTGSRQTGLKASDSPAPIQIVSAEALKSAGAPDLMSALSAIVPSLQMQAFGFDMA
jgi:iron complex outermembrane receptor protein